jgi:SAM-dependent methyltransferase
VDSNRPAWYGPHEKDARKLDLGCGLSKIPGSIGVDCIDDPAIDVVHSLDDFPYPLDDDSFDAVYLNHCLEHLADPKRTLEECTRLARPGGAIYLMVPHFTCSSSFGDVTHLRYFSDRAIPTLGRNVASGSKRLKLTNRHITARIPFLAPLINLAPRLWEDYFCFMATGRTLFYRFEVTDSAQSAEI